MTDCIKFELLAQHTLHELSLIVDLIEANRLTHDLHQKIDIFFYRDQTRKARLLYADMKLDQTQCMELYTDLCRIEVSIKSRWKNDYRFIATPVFLHEYFG